MMILTSLFSGLALGLANGLSPGPVVALILSQTLTYGLKEGIKAAVAPIFTSPITVGASLLILSRISGVQSLLGIFGIVGGLLLLRFALFCFRAKVPNAAKLSNGPPRSFLKAAALDIFNPNPYLFWTFVGGSLLLRGTAEQGMSFFAGFFGGLIGSNIVVAILAWKMSGFFQGRAYLFLIRAIGILLLCFGLSLGYQGIQLLIVSSLHP